MGTIMVVAIKPKYEAHSECRTAGFFICQISPISIYVVEFM